MLCFTKKFPVFHTVWATLRTVWYDAPRAGFSKIVPRPLLAIFLQKPKMAALGGIAGSENRPD